MANPDSGVTAAVRAGRCLTLAGELVRSERVNAIIVGSGAGGGMMAKELAEAGLTVVLFERGKQYSGADFNHSELKCQCDTDWPLVYGPTPNENPRTFRYTDGEEARTVYPGVDDQYGRTPAAVGSATIFERVRAPSSPSLFLPRASSWQLFSPLPWVLQGATFLNWWERPSAW